MSCFETVSKAIREQHQRIEQDDTYAGESDGMDEKAAAHQALRELTEKLWIEFSLSDQGFHSNLFAEASGYFSSSP